MEQGTLDWSILRDRWDYAHRILIVGHGECGDGYGAATALARFGARHNKDIRILMPGKHSAFVDVLFPGISYEHDPANISLSWPDLIVAVDIADVEMIGLGQRLISAMAMGTSIVAVDHHRVHRHFTDQLIFDPDAPAASLMIYKAFREWNEPIGADIATALAFGIASDTDMFRNGATNAEALRIYGELARAGANVSDIVQCLMNRVRSVDTLRVWGRAWERSWVDADGILVIPMVPEQDTVATNDSGGLSNGMQRLLGFNDRLRGVLVLNGLQTDESGNPYVTGSARTTLPDMDVAAIAMRYGGGGHKQAAGFKVKGRLLVEDSDWRVV